MSPAARDRQTAVLIGNFDGVHIGHQDLVRAAAGFPGVKRVAVLAFDPHPSVILRSSPSGPAEGPGRLSSFEQRAARLRSLGADEVIRLLPSEELLSLTPEAFIRDSVLPLDPIVIVEGADFRFGARRAGGIQTLRALGEGFDFDVKVVPDCEITLTDQTIVRASSTLTRWLLTNGRVRDAASVLDRPYDLTGTVHRGDRRGRTIGFPTANILTDQLLPQDGVYACRAVLPDGREFMAAANIGDRPTFNTNRRTLEAHLIDAPTDGDAVAGLPEYGWDITLEFISRVRDQIRFSSIDALKSQLARDIDTTRRRTRHSSEILA